MPIDPTIEEVREAIENHIRIWDGEPAAEVAARHAVRRVLDDLKQVAAPKPRPSTRIINETIRHHVGKQITDGVIEDNDERITYCVLRCQIENDLRDEGWNLVHEGGPVTPATQPVVDTGESPRVQLAKQIDTLAKLLGHYGFQPQEFRAVVALVRDQVTHRLEWPDDLGHTGLFTLWLTHIHRRELCLDDVLAVLRHQFAKSPTIVQAIDRLVELRRITHESETA